MPLQMHTLQWWNYPELTKFDKQQIPAKSVEETIQLKTIIFIFCFFSSSLQRWCFVRRVI